MWLHKEKEINFQEFYLLAPELRLKITANSYSLNCISSFSQRSRLLEAKTCYDQLTAMIQEWCMEHKATILPEGAESGDVRIVNHLFSDGTKMKGEWKNAQVCVYFRRHVSSRVQPHGHGTILTQEHTYEGEIEDYKPNGEGAMTFPNGAKYEGSWKAGLPHGHGTLTCPTKDGQDEYVGEWDMGQRSSRGVQYWALTGWKYEGNWENNRIHGEGTMTYGDTGYVYTGSWKADRFEGEGILWQRGNET